MKQVDHPLLDLAAMEALRRVGIAPKGLTEGSYAGPHRSRYRGTSVDFADYRHYTQGDDIRLVDWKAYARSDRHYIRLFESERNLVVLMVVDTSGSMAYEGMETKTLSKLDYAARLAAVLGYLAVRDGNEAGLSLADESVHRYLPPGKSVPHYTRLLDAMSEAKPSGKTDLGDCLEALHSLTRRRGVVVVFSDFLHDSEHGNAKLWNSVNLFRRSYFDIMLFHIVHPEELELPSLVNGKFIDAENALSRAKVDIELVREEYRKRFAAFLTKTRTNARVRGCDWFLANTGHDPYGFVKRCFLGKAGS